MELGCDERLRLGELSLLLSLLPTDEPHRPKPSPWERWYFSR